ncbi:MAG: sugar ABC transporter permease [Cellulomonadaceae bacterium]|nr:sugar ABC transporter permease [Cellulomonadaceae bacterium]
MTATLTPRRASGTVPPPDSRAYRTGSLRRRRSLAAWGFALPFVLLFAVFTVYPVVTSLFMSVTDIRSRDLRNPFAVNFVGFDNFAAVLTDETFHKAALNTAYFVVVGVPLTIVISLAIAIALNTGITKASGFFRVGYYMPVVTSIVAVAVVWRFLLRPDNGLINEVLGLVGIQGPNWLESPTWAMPSLIVMATWRSMGTLIVIFLAGLQSVPKTLHEAAALDGATAWQRLRSITLPTLRPTLLFGAVITGIGYLQFFEEPFVMTQGGPLNSTLSVSYYIYNQFGFGNYGFAAAMSYVLMLAIVILTVIQFRVLTERDDVGRKEKRRARERAKAVRAQGGAR